MLFTGLLSTLPQVSAALVGLVGLLALFSLEEPLRRRARFEDEGRADIERNRSGSYQFPQDKIIHAIAFEKLESTPGDELISALKDWLKTNKKWKDLRDLVAAWEKVNDWISTMYKTFYIFVGVNLIVIFGSLISLLYVPALVKWDWMESVTKLACFIVVIIAARVIHLAMTRPRF